MSKPIKLLNYCNYKCWFSGSFLRAIKQQLNAKIQFLILCVCVVESWECTPLRCGEKRVSGSKCHCSSDCLSAADCCTNYGIVCNGETTHTHIHKYINTK